MTEKTDPSAIPLVWYIEGADSLTIYARPEELTFTMRKRLNRYRTRGGWIEEDWGDEMDVISGSGRTDAFVLPGVGLVRYCAEQTEAYQKFKELLNFYRNNGFRYDQRGNVVEAVDDQLNLQQEQVVFFYRNASYYGYFNSLEWREEAERPFQFSWSFEFQVVMTVYGY